jgi:hypothetical protein
LCSFVDGNYAEGEQLFENYGQPNYVYFMYHGFVLDENTHDCVQFDLHMSEEEHAALDMGANGFVFEKLQRHLQSPSHLGICLSYPIPEEVWLFLALKDNSVAELKASETLGERTEQHAAYLASLVEARIQHLIDNISRSHAPTARFLQSEIDLLRRVGDFLVSGEEGHAGLKPGVSFRG